MKQNRIILTVVLCGAASLASAQMMPNGGSQPTMPQSPTGQPGRPGTLGGEVPSTVGQTNNPNTGTQVPKVDDATLEKDVKQQLASDPAFAMVQVSAHNGHVDLSGSVASKDDRKKAREMAKSVPGVLSVKEHLTVGGGKPSTAGTMGNGASASDSTGQNTAGSISGNAQKSNADSGNAAPPNSAPGSTPDQTTPPPSSTPEANPQSTPPSDTTPHASTTTPGGVVGA